MNPMVMKLINIRESQGIGTGYFANYTFKQYPQREDCFCEIMTRFSPESLGLEVGKSYEFAFKEVEDYDWGPKWVGEVGSEDPDWRNTSLATYMQSVHSRNEGSE